MVLKCLGTIFIPLVLFLHYFMLFYNHKLPYKLDGERQFSNFSSDSQLDTVQDLD